MANKNGVRIVEMNCLQHVTLSSAIDGEQGAYHEREHLDRDLIKQSFAS
jgi:hypothetical protein